MTRPRNYLDVEGYGSEPVSILYGMLIGAMVVGAGALGLVLS